MILSDEQIADAITDNTEATPVGYVVFITSRDRKIAKAQDAQTRQDTLMEVGKWVNNHLHESPACSYKWCFGDRTWQSKLKEWGLAHNQK